MWDSFKGAKAQRRRLHSALAGFSIATFDPVHVQAGPPRCPDIGQVFVLFLLVDLTPVADQSDLSPVCFAGFPMLASRSP